MLKTETPIFLILDAQMIAVTCASNYSAATITGVTQTKLTNHKAERKQ